MAKTEDIKKVEKAEVKKTEVVKSEKDLSKNKYEVAVTGFFALGKMFRPETKIDYNTYKDYISKWLDEGSIRVKK